MRDEAPGTEGAGSQHKCFVGGLSYAIGNSELKAAFERFDCVDAEVMIDRHTNRPRGFGFVYFKDEHGQKEAIEQMHDKELEGRRISVVKAVPQDQTKPGTPAAILGGGPGARRDYVARRDAPRYGDRGYGDRGYDRGGYGGGYERGGYGGGYDPRYAYDRGGYDYRGYSGYERGGDPYRDAYRGSYGAYGYGYDDRGYSSSYGYERGYDDRGAGGPDRRGYSSSARSAPYDRPAADRRPSDPPRR